MTRLKRLNALLPSVPGRLASQKACLPLLSSETQGIQEDPRVWHSLGIASLGAIHVSGELGSLNRALRKKAPNSFSETLPLAKKTVSGTLFVVLFLS